MRGISQRFRRSAKEQGRKQTFDEPAAGLAAISVGHFDLRLAESDFCRDIFRPAFQHFFRSLFRHLFRDVARNCDLCHAVWPRMFTMAVLRCS